MTQFSDDLERWLPIRYAAPVLLAVAVALFFPVTSGMQDSERRTYWRLQAITLIGAVLGAKLVALMGDRLWPVVPLVSWTEILTSGRSIVGGLIFGFIAAELAKPVLGYNRPPNDRFATLLPFTFAIGRVGCFLQGCCLGAPHDGLLSVTFHDAIPRYPTQLFEVLFNLMAGVTFLILQRSERLRGRFFATYLIAYGIYRFGTEFIRDTPHVLAGYSVYQLFSIAMVILGFASFLKHTPRTGGEEWEHDAGTA